MERPPWSTVLRASDTWCSQVCRDPPRPEDHCGGFSCGARAVGAWASVVTAHGLSSCGSQALEHRLSSCSATCGIVPDQGLNPCLLHWQEGSLPFSHQGSPTKWFKKIYGLIFSEICLFCFPPLQLFGSSYLSLFLRFHSQTFIERLCLGRSFVYISEFIEPSLPPHHETLSYPFSALVFIGELDPYWIPSQLPLRGGNWGVFFFEGFSKARFLSYASFCTNSITHKSCS